MFLWTSIRIIVRAVRQFAADGAGQMAAALAYYALFSTAPLLLLAVMFAGLFFGEVAARERVVEHLTELVGPEGAREITRHMADAVRVTPSWQVAGLGAAVWLFGALSAFLHVRHCLAVIWRLDPPSENSILAVLFNYLLAIVAVLSVCGLLLCSVGLSTALVVFHRYLEAELPGGVHYWRQVYVGVSFTFLMLFFALIFRVMSRRRIAWRHVLYGACVTALLFAAGKFGISWYLAHTSAASAYGAAGSVVVYLLWVCYSAQIFFFGAELVQARRTKHEWMVSAKIAPKAPLH